VSDWNDYAFISQSPLSGAWIALVAVVVLGFVSFSVVAYVRAGRRYWLLAALHIVAALGLLAALLQPALDLRSVTRIPGRIAIVVDDSQSMAQKDGTEKTRAEQVQAWMETHAAELEAMKGQNAIDFYTLSGAGKAARTTTQESKLLSALSSPLETNTKARPLAAVVLFSDGADTDVLGNAADDDARAALLEPLKKQRVPVSTVLIGSGKTRDLFIADLAQDPIAFVRNTVKVDVTVGGKGFSDLSVPVSLKRDGALVTQQMATLSRGKSAKVTFEIIPDEVGEFVYSASVPVQTDEAVTDNNSRDFVLKVVRDKIRALLVSGRPSWDERFLRRTLKMSPNVDLISFFILRTPSDFNLVPQNESSLIPFPTQELFDTELHTFDVVVLQNFDYRPYNMSYLLKNLREHVEKGGALAMFGGENSFGGGAYAQTPLADVLPVEMSATEMDYREFTPHLTPAGEKHPVLRLQPGGASRQKALQQLPKLAGAMKVDGLAPQSTALLVHPELKGKDGQPMPVVAVREVGRGRTLAVTTDSLWRWSYTDKMRGETGASYERLIGQMFRWLMRDPEASRLRLSASRDQVKVGESVDFSVRVLGSDYQPTAKVAVTLTLEEKDRPAMPQSGETNADGVYSFSHPVQRGGVIKAIAETRIDDEPVSATLLVYGDDADKERSALAPRDDVMASIARELSGSTQRIERADPSEWPKAEASTSSVDRHKEVPLWNTWLALLLVSAALSLEWYLRRRWGFV
jgi:uncharacterized membrane protein